VSSVIDVLGPNFSPCTFVCHSPRWVPFHARFVCHLGSLFTLFTQSPLPITSDFQAMC